MEDKVLFIFRDKQKIEEEIGKETVDQISTLLHNFLTSGNRPSLQKVRKGEHFKRFSVPVMEGVHVDFFLVRYVMGSYVVRFAEIVNENEIKEEEAKE